jgi:O-acetyl-ADP-ribose deacetylase (regulator of RNase III)
MSGASDILKDEFQFGSTVVRIIQGNIVAPGMNVDAVVSTDDNYLTMASGVSRVLAERAGPYYVRAAQAQCPVRAGTVVVTKAYQLPEHGLDVKQVLHAAIIDLDTEDLPLEQVVYRATANCLERAEESGLRSILFPAFATGSGGLSMEACAHQMCSAIKTYVAQERSLKAIYVILYLPQARDRGTEAGGVAERKARNQRFVREANLVLGVPYDPALDIRQTRDFYGREEELKQLEEIITGKKDDEDGKRHAVVLGGPEIGKWALLDQVYCQAQRPGSTLSEGRRLVEVTFGRVHENTPASFIYRKLLCAMGRSEDDEDTRKEIRRAYAEPDMDRDRFLQFLEDHSDRYPEVVLLINRLPRLLQMDIEDPEDPNGARAFWSDLDRLQARVRFVYTARDDDRYQELRRERFERFSPSFHSRMLEVRLRCVAEQEREDWVDGLFERYLGRTASDFEHRFFEEEAGRHPYLISLAGHALIERIKRDRLDRLDQHTEQYYEPALASSFRDARKAMERPRQDFFALLMDALDRGHRVDLQNLARAVAIEEQKRLLLPGIERGDPNASALWQELQAEGDPREFLHDDRLRQLEARGYLVKADTPKEAQFMARSFAAYVAESLSDVRREEDRPTDVVISLLSPRRQVIRTMFRGRGARVITAQKQLPAAVKDEFMRSFSGYISHRLRPTQDTDADSGVFRDAEEVSKYILTQFTTVAIKRYLDSPRQGSTIFFMVDDNYKDIPWELMLESVYAGEIPFRVGRSIVSQQEPHSIRPPVRGIRKIKALLIGNPTGDLDEASHEVQSLADRLRRDARFEAPDVLIGPEHCRRIRLLNALAGGRYGLVHYSGHTRFDEEQSAWHLKDGDITTDMLTNAVQMAPPAFIFSSSCESAVSAEAQPITYEDQTFDLPGAFLQAGVEAYVGTLWAVDALAARLFTKEFYDAFLSGEHNLGECLRRAKWARKQQEEREGQINWLAFILYGDPHIEPGDLFPAMRRQED